MFGILKCMYRRLGLGLNVVRWGVGVGVGVGDPVSTPGPVHPIFRLWRSFGDDNNFEGELPRFTTLRISSLLFLIPKKNVVLSPHIHSM